jgi:hypothetical protein
MLGQQLHRCQEICDGELKTPKVIAPGSRDPLAPSYAASYL